MMLKVRFNKPCHAARRVWQPGEEGNFTAELAQEIAGLGVGEIVGSAEEVTLPGPHEYHEENVVKPKRTRKTKESQGEPHDDNH